MIKKFSTLIEKDLHSVRELSEAYQQLIPHFKDRTLLLLMGPVGAGKTTSVQTLAQLMGIEDVASPSFAIHHRYENSAGASIDHVDLYRLTDEDDLENTGFWDLFGQRKSLVIVEWAEKLNPEQLPLNWYQVRVHLQLEEGSVQRHLKIEIQQG